MRSPGRAGPASRRRTWASGAVAVAGPVGTARTLDNARQSFPGHRSGTADHAARTPGGSATARRSEPANP